MSKRTRNLHVWKTRTVDGRQREVRAQLHASKWTLTSRCKGEELWITHDPPLVEDLEALHEVLFNKYQRSHLAWEHLEGVKKLLEARLKVESEKHIRTLINATVIKLSKEIAKGGAK